MKKRTWKNIMLCMMTVFTAIGFVMCSSWQIEAEESSATLKSGIRINTALKELIHSTDTSITAFSRTTIYNEEADKIYLSSDEKVSAWIDDNTVYWYCDASPIYMNVDSSYLFAGLTEFTSIDVHGMDASRVTDMSHLFEGDTSITSLDLSIWDTSSVTDMNSMFTGMSSLSSLNIDEMDTSSVTNLSNMFTADTSLTQVDLSSFTVSQEAEVTDIYTDSALEKIYISQLWASDTSQDSRFKLVYPAYFVQNLTMAADATMQDISFTYSITPGEPIAHSESSDEVKAGFTNEDCMVKNVSFTPLDSTYVGTPEDCTANDKKHMQKTVKILIDPSLFTEPGIYRYVITESTALDGVSGNLFRLDENTQRILDVLVEYPENQELNIAASVVHRSAISMKGVTLASEEKNSGYTNSYLLTTNNLKISNDYEGNMSSSRMQFTYHLTIDDDIPGRVLKAVYSNGTVEDLTVDESGHAAMDVVLTGSQCVTIKDIQKQATYAIVSDKAQLETYGFSLTLSTASPTVSVDKDTGSMINPSVSEDVEVIFRNFRDCIVPTGIILDTAPYVLCMCMGAAGIILLRKKKKADKMESE